MNRFALLVVLSLSAVTHAQHLTLTDEGTLKEGDRPVSQREFYTLMGRGDLVQRSDERVARRKWFTLGAAVGGGLLVISGAAVLATTPNLASPWCEADKIRYNTVCMPDYRLHVDAGAVLLVAGGVVGALLGGLAWWSGPDLLSIHELDQAVDDYNQGKRAPSPNDVAPPQVQLTPVITPNGWAMVLTVSL